MIPIPLVNTILIALGSLTITAAVVFVLFTMAFFAFAVVWRIFVPYQPQEIEEHDDEERDEVE